MRHFTLSYSKPSNFAAYAVSLLLAVVVLFTLVLLRPWAWLLHRAE